MARPQNLAPAAPAAVKELERLLHAVREGQLSTRADLSQFDGENAHMLKLANSLVDELVTPLRVASRSLSEIASGNIPEFVIDDYRGEFDDIKRNINHFLATMQGMHHEATTLISAIKQGKLHARGNEWDFEGTWRELIAGMNGVVDAFERPFEIASSCVRNISQGTLPPPIEKGLKGEYGRLAKNLNGLTSTVRQITHAVTQLTASAIAGKLDERIGQDGFLGDWQALVIGINETLNSALAPIAEAGRVLERVAAYDLCARVEGDYKGDHAAIKHALNLTAETLRHALVQVATSTKAVAEAGDEIANSAKEVTQGTQRQALAVDSMTQQTERLLEHARSNAQLSKSARHCAEEVASSVATGKVSASRVSTVMSEVATATASSTKVIQEIDAIAAQTDTLAVTASSEATRVASSGRGFAVVADEVRRLAQQSKEAAAKIEALLADIGRLLAGSGHDARGGTRDSISAIVREIQQIAFQTNLLAVNAAVEAAHVSAASGGFESITAEIRALAQRAKTAAEQTRSLTLGAHQAAENGKDFAQGLEHDFSAIVGGMSSITSSIETIEAATSEQQNEIRSVAVAMNEIKRATDSNARSAEGSSTFANRLIEETLSLSQMVEQFRLNATEDVSVPPRHSDVTASRRETGRLKSYSA